MANRVNLGNIIGATGATGPQGPAGQNGADGLTPYIQNGTWWIGSQDTNVIAKGNEWYYGTEIPTVQGNNGDLYLNTNTNDVYKKENGIWGVIANIKGDQGVQGEQGENATSLEIGTITTLNSDQVATAELVPLGDGAYELNLGIPKGEQGQQGEQGEDGRTTVFVSGFAVNSISFDDDPQTQIDNKLERNFGSINAGKYLQVDNNGNVQAVSSDAENDVIEGYYYNGAFYEDSEHTDLIVGNSGIIYIDLTENIAYIYQNNEYVVLTGGVDTSNLVEKEVTSGQYKTKILSDGEKIVLQKLPEEITPSGNAEEQSTIGIDEDGFAYMQSDEAHLITAHPAYQTGKIYAEDGKIMYKKINHNVEVDNEYIDETTESEIASLSDISSKQDKPTEENYTIATNSWTALSLSDPYTYSATVTATYVIGNDTEVGIVADQPVLFANYGFVVGAVSGQNVTIYALEQPSASVTLSVSYRG